MKKNIKAPEYPELNYKMFYATRKNRPGDKRSKTPRKVGRR